jgi:hypothetical protein
LGQSWPCATTTARSAESPYPSILDGAVREWHVTSDRVLHNAHRIVLKGPSRRGTSQGLL